MSDLQITFDDKSFDDLDQLALLACQDYNLGCAGDWFGEFRGGLYGFYARLYGVSLHYLQVHAWLPRPRLPTETEYHLAAILFCMDSALECFTFALNAFGYAGFPSDFRDVTDEHAQRQINPLDITRDQSSSPEPLPGYAKAFPTVQQHWRAHSLLIAKIRDLHDVSKHRRTIFIGGQGRLDTPEGFYGALGVPDDSALRTLFLPMAEILLKPDPKVPTVARTPKPRQELELLEQLVPEFAHFISKTGELALHDARSTIPLNEWKFRTA